MHEHDIERIAALAEGRLEANEVAAAEADIRSCEQCSMDLEEQRTAISFMREAGQPTLTDLERASLHRNVREATAPRSSRFVRLVPAFAAAAALVMVFGVASLFGRSGGTTVEFAPEAQELTTSVAGKSEADTSVAQESARELAGAPAPAPAPAATTDDLLDLATTLRSTDSATFTSMKCDSQALELAEEDPLAVTDVTIEGMDALLYVYPETALAFDATSCELIRRIPAP